jgi:hypothetical protein
VLDVANRKPSIDLAPALKAQLIRLIQPPRQ